MYSTLCCRRTWDILSTFQSLLYASDREQGQAIPGASILYQYYPGGNNYFTTLYLYQYFTNVLRDLFMHACILDEMKPYKNVKRIKSFPFQTQYKLTHMPNKRGREPKHIGSIGSIGRGRGGSKTVLKSFELNTVLFLIQI